MKTLPTLNSKNFKQVKCPTCEKYPERKRGGPKVPIIKFLGIRWVAEEHMLEFQGYCVHCFKEHRIQVEGIGHDLLHEISLFNPKLSKDVGPIEEHLKRWN